MTVQASAPDAFMAQAFIAKWQGVAASELSTAQTFTADLCDLLGVPKPHATPEQDYMFERPITFAHGDGSASAGRIDCYRRGAFVLEAKKLRAASSSKVFDDAMLRARAQAEGYARALPASELTAGRPPFLLVVDVGNVIELYAEFSRSGATYTPFPDPRSHRIALADLAKEEVRAKLRAIWLEPDSLNPARISARVTREVSQQLAALAKSLEASGHPPEHVAGFLTRCLFCMFAEDVELLPKVGGIGSFLGLLQSHAQDAPTLANMLRVLWADMDRGGFSAALAAKVLKFNGKLFKQSAADGFVLLLNAEQIKQLIAAAQSNWREVEPAIFGTLLERALSPAERHALGAHYTPRAYVERLVLPTVVEPLRADWANAQAAAVLLAGQGDLKGAQAEVRRFHHQLCTTRVLDPACGSGNFLYVTLEHLKRLEGEVLNQLAELGETQDKLGFAGETVTLQQLIGIELSPRAAALAELVLWIGFLQWHIRTRGNAAVAEPVVHDYGNIECRDAVLAWDGQQPARGASGELLQRWDGKTFKTHPVTGALVPDEAALVPQWQYLNARKAHWPPADFIVGNPPFIGNKRMREALGDGYAQALRAAWPEVPESADFVMYWWAHSGALVGTGQARRMGLITTNSLTMTFNRRVIEAALKGLTLAGLEGSGARHAAALILPNAQKSAGSTPYPAAGAVALVFAIPDHPWVDSANGAAVRIAMTVGAPAAGSGLAATTIGKLFTVVSEQTGEFGEVGVSLVETTGLLHADLSIGANVAAAVALTANGGISSPGVKLHGAGFIVTPDEAAALGFGSVPGAKRLIREYRNGRDLTDTPRGVMVIDAFGLPAEQLRAEFPAIYQRLQERVKPERDQNNRASYRDNWWIFGEPRKDLRPALAGLRRYIVTPVTAKHRTFQFMDASVLADDALICIASEAAFLMGLLSSGVHAVWALATGSTLEDRPRYIKTTCFETFPFPQEDTGLTPALRDKIAALAEQIDAHRKRQQAQHPGLTLTGMYNVLEALRAGAALTDKEKTIHSQGLVGVLRELHNELDAAVLAAYGFPVGLDKGELLTRLVALNASRAAEEKAGTVRWLRPEFQDPALRNSEQHAQAIPPQQAEMALEIQPTPAGAASAAPAAKDQQAWPAELPAQVRAVAALLAASPAAALGLPQIEAHFKGRGPWKKSLPRILETLEALGRARQEGALWRAG